MVAAHDRGGVTHPRADRAGGLSAFTAGLDAQFSRVDQFMDTADPAAARRGARIVTEFLRPRVPQLREQAGLPAGRGTAARGRGLAAADHALAADVDLPVYCYWNSGMAAAPELVRACMLQLREHHPAAQFLDAASVRDLIDIPDRIAAVLETDRPAHFADFVRVALLERYGGIWVDATCWVPHRLERVILPFLDAGVVYPRWTTGQIGNWFIAAVPGSLVITLQRIALEMWWTERSDLPDYFLYHRIFEALHSLVPEFRGEWSEASFLSSAASHLLQLSMMQPWFPALGDLIDGLSIVQKLSYKYDPASVPEGSVLTHLLQTHSL
ncbi:MULTISPECIES: capsular polysaccharide synthesis protein [unclassified Microbacterium]|uniref:capsular polysaccharide synthesis protein n=1 Tax=unclassified Microbacterium TaxID=2609290 RepID=UPI00214B9082|nr:MULTISPECIES: capsular polysaccharide synthesis protein [unclassified Microbacterium]MCR2783100.1 capsular polysaccharide synthesis protein [Microbacterium sp. zg.B96]WIM16016.1 capsular polysaccharide synthesis protein [Microbacterium sp. zg-B96]